MKQITLEEKIMKKFDRWQEAWAGQRFEKGSLREASLKDFLCDVLDDVEKEVREEIGLKV